MVPGGYMRPFGTRTVAICLMNIILVATLLPGTITGLDISFMKNTSPVNDDPSITEFMVREGERCGYARVYPIGAISRGMKGEELAEFGLMNRAGAVAVSDDGLPVSDTELMRRALLHAQHFDLPVVQHCEDLNLSSGGDMHEGEQSTRLGLRAIPSCSEDVMVARDLVLTGVTDCRYHVAHLSTKGSMEVRSRVLAARALQEGRLSGLGGAGADAPRSNAEIPDGSLDTLVDASPSALRLLGRAVDGLPLSARAARRLLRVARTVADLAGDARVDDAAVAEALSYRQTCFGEP